MRRSWDTDYRGPASVRSFLGQLGALGLEEMLDAAREVGYGAGEYIFRRGDAPSHVYVVLAGAAQLSGTQSERRVGIEVLQPGDLFGHNALLAGTLHFFDAHALEATRLLVFPSSVVLARLEQRSDLLQAWLVWVNEQVIRLRRRLADTLGGPLEYRLARFLVSQAARGELGLTQGELAHLLGVHRGTVNRALKELEVAGIITTGYRRIRVIDPARLARLADMPRGRHAQELPAPLLDLRADGVPGGL